MSPVSYVVTVYNKAPFLARVLAAIEAERGGGGGGGGLARAAQEKLVRLVDGDDLVTPGSTALLVRALEETGCEFAFGRTGSYEPDRPGDIPAARSDAVVSRLRER